MKWNPSSKPNSRSTNAPAGKRPPIRRGPENRAPAKDFNPSDKRPSPYSKEGRPGASRPSQGAKSPRPGAKAPSPSARPPRPGARGPNSYESKPSPISPRRAARVPREVIEGVGVAKKPFGRVAPAKFVPKVVLDDDRRVYGIHAVAATLTHMPDRAKKLYYIEKNVRTEPLIHMAQKAGLIIEQCARQIFDVNYGTDIVHQGVMLMTSPFPYVEIDAALNKTTKLVVVLDGIEDPRNLGRAARSAFALGAQLLVIPTNRAACVSASAEKAAVGTFSRIPVAQVTNLNQALEKLKKAGLWVVGSAGEASQPLWESDLNRPTAVVIGSEESGLRKLVRENCDELVRIPMNAGDMSLNAADALTIMLYEVQRQRAAGLKS